MRGNISHSYKTTFDGMNLRTTWNALGLVHGTDLGWVLCHIW